MISTKKLSKQYGDELVFSNVDIELPRQGLVILSGPSGSGKTSLLNILAGFDNEYKGAIKVDDVELNTLKDKVLQEYHRSKIGFIYQDFNLIPHLTAFENIKLSGNHDEHDIHEIMDSLNILELKDQVVDTCSGGEQQRVAIARTLVKSPQIILADEPTGSLDKKNTAIIMDILTNISKTRLVIVSSHNPKHTSLANEVLYFKDDSIQHDICNRISEVKFETVKHPFGNLDWLRPINKRFQKKKQTVIATLLAFSSILTLISFNSNAIFQSEIDNFITKNHHYKTISTPYSDETYELIKNSDLLNDYYIQYKLDEKTLSWKQTELELEAKYPVTASKQYLSFGQMPRADKKEIALSPSLAGKLNKQTHELIGETVFLDDIELIVSGIFNLSYDDYILSAQIEKQLMDQVIDKEPLSITANVKDIKDLDLLITQNDNVKIDSANDEVSAFLYTFDTIENTFKVISLVILGLILYLVYSIIKKTQSSRKNELGLLRSLGYTKEEIDQYLYYDTLNLIRYFLTSSLILFIVVTSLSNIFLNLVMIKITSFIVVSVLLSIYIIIIYRYTNRKILNIKPSIALK